MKIDIEHDSQNRLESGDCILISGIVGKELQVTFQCDGKNVFKFKFHIMSGWDVLVWDENKTDINSGSNYPSLEYKINKLFTLCFELSNNQITTTLNETVICTSQLSTAVVSRITNLNLSTDGQIKYISFTDSSSRSSSIIQPTIYQAIQPIDDNEAADANSDIIDATANSVINSLQQNTNPTNTTTHQQISLIENRQRMIFKFNKNQMNSHPYSDSDSDSDPDDSDLFHHHCSQSDCTKTTSNLHDYIKKLVEKELEKSRLIIDYNEITECLKHEKYDFYKLNYYEPHFDETTQLNLIDNTDLRGMNFFAHKAYNLREKISKVNTELVEIGDKINRTKTQSISSYDSIINDRLLSPTSVILSYPSSKITESYFKFDLTADNCKKSKIPILQHIISPKVEIERPKLNSKITINANKNNINNIINNNGTSSNNTKNKVNYNTKSTKRDAQKKKKRTSNGNKKK